MSKNPRPLKTENLKLNTSPCWPRASTFRPWHFSELNTEHLKLETATSGGASHALRPLPGPAGRRGQARRLALALLLQVDGIARLLLGIELFLVRLLLLRLFFVLGGEFLRGELAVGPLHLKPIPPHVLAHDGHLLLVILLPVQGQIFGPHLAQLLHQLPGHLVPPLLLF